MFLLREIERDGKGGDSMEDINRVHIIFTTFLAAAAWQDLRNKSVSVWLYLGYGAVAGAIRLTGGEPVLQALSGGLVGVVLLAAGWMTAGAIGIGDGLFFVVSGLYLSFYDNVRLLLYGILWGGIFCLFLFLHGKKHGINIHRMTVLFLPFLIPGWIWMVIS